MISVQANSVVVPRTKNVVGVALVSDLERRAVLGIHAILDGIAALILIATQTEANAVPMEAIALLEIVTSSTHRATTVSSAFASSITRSAASSITSKPIPEYEYYYFTITWYYWSYYYYYYTTQLELSTLTRSTRITTTTKLSIYETSSAAARSSFKQLTATISLPTPAAANLPTLTPLSTPESTVYSSDTSLKAEETSNSLITQSPTTISSTIATASPISIIVSGAASSQMDWNFWSGMGFTVCGAFGVALWLL
ncbi:hypothetical protein SBOR_0180 [Sclerotinia borealis F-4128]|uniref:Uncharacterized protein n=1 Tax=Sclerotinia borealis (strain F-4128) TaxID=1432307 RepID=W9CTG5_SCLBF|nr:hypothetical protein SBOR_0180 [Sclerotinia borealis F-4128]